MTQWIITRKCQYTETACVEANSKFEAWEKAQSETFHQQCDDTIIEEQIEEVK